jgi:hypothetical protein
MSADSAPATARRRRGAKRSILGGVEGWSGWSGEGGGSGGVEWVGWSGWRRMQTLYIGPGRDMEACSLGHGTRTLSGSGLAPKYRHCRLSIGLPYKDLHSGWSRLQKQNGSYLGFEFLMIVPLIICQYLPHLVTPCYIISRTPMIFTLHWVPRDAAGTGCNICQHTLRSTGCSHSYYQGCLTMALWHYGTMALWLHFRLLLAQTGPFDKPRPWAGHQGSQSNSVQNAIIWKLCNDQPAW